MEHQAPSRVMSRKAQIRICVVAVVWPILSWIVVITAPSYSPLVWIPSAFVYALIQHKLRTELLFASPFAGLLVGFWLDYVINGKTRFVRWSCIVLGMVLSTVVAMFVEIEVNIFRDQQRENQDAS